MPKTAKCLSVKNPYAGWIADGAKTIELRSWHTHYRGPLVICASQKGETQTHGMPDGVARCLVTLSEVRPFLPSDAAAARNQWRSGLYAWVLTDRRPLPPIPVKGRLGLFPPPPPLWRVLLRPASRPRTGNPSPTSANRRGTARASTPARA